MTNLLYLYCSVRNDVLAISSAHLTIITKLINIAPRLEAEGKEGRKKGRKRGKGGIKGMQ